jgi:hypothetical protein
VAYQVENKVQMHILVDICGVETCMLHMVNLKMPLESHFLSLSPSLVASFFLSLFHTTINFCDAFNMVLFVITML